MNIDVKNSIDQLLTVCRQIDAVRKKSTESVTDLVISDLRNFVGIISRANKEERLEYFNEMYINIKTPNISADFPAALPVICQIDNTVLKSRGMCVSALYLETISIIGKQYLLSKQDKKDIDAQRFKDIIKSLQDYIASQSPEVSEEKLPASDPIKGEGKTVESLDENPVKEQEESLEELMKQLNDLIGLNSVKTEVTSLINLLKIKKIREERGMKTADVSKHLVFLGNPGTGKTTVARLLSKIYKQLGALENGQLVEVDRAGLVAGYVGQTALKTKEKIDEAMGGILFIDEAYTLAKGGNDFGQEAIDTILKSMEDHRDSFVVIVAGYPEPMERFLESNPGLKSRFNKVILFEDYSEEELFLIFECSCRKCGMHLTEEAKIALKEYIDSLCMRKPDNFANGREMRNLFEAAYVKQANRLAMLSELSDDELNEITVDDLALDK
ncbi:MAG: AAA family ATPase [Lachnospiraceae bacterium]|nr:AAA family ATPase [Lachnospiraceae bacterium]